MRYNDVQDTRKHVSAKTEQDYRFNLFERTQRLCTYFGAVFPV